MSQYAGQCKKCDLALAEMDQVTGDNQFRCTRCDYVTRDPIKRGHKREKIDFIPPSMLVPSGRLVKSLVNIRWLISNLWISNGRHPELSRVNKQLQNLALSEGWETI